MNTNSQFELHEVEWTDPKVARFWDSFSKLSHMSYFAEQVGRRILSLYSGYINKKGKILDYGSGKGFLIGYLLESGATDVAGCDFSDESVIYVGNTFASTKGFTGCTLIKSLPSSLAGDYYDTVFFTETIEHLLDQHYVPTLKELGRLVRKGGYVIVTTRNNENLNDLKVVCPDCGSMFHRVQHVRSFSRESISAAMGEFGFKTIVCETRHLSRPWLVNFAAQSYRKLQGLENNNPNLIYIGQKI